ncbi:MAG: hypothetical protein ACPLPR_08035 [Bacillota bacterium]
MNLNVVKDWTLKQAYLHLVAFVSLMIVIIGLISTVIALLDFVFPPEYYSPGPADVYMRYLRQDGSQELPKEIVQEQIEFEKAQARRNQLVSIYRGLKRGIAYVLVGLPVWLYHWRRIRVEA